MLKSTILLAVFVLFATFSFADEPHEGFESPDFDVSIHSHSHDILVAAKVPEPISGYREAESAVIESSESHLTVLAVSAHAGAMLPFEVGWQSYF